jgi:hypothetical protein
MVNLRNLLPSNPLVIVATVGVLVLVYFAGRHQEITSKLDFALLAAVLVGYHVYMHDLSTLAIPLRFHRHGRIAMICVSALTLLNDPVFFRLTGLSVLILLLIRIKPRVCMGMNSTKNFSTG